MYLKKYYKIENAIQKINKSIWRIHQSLLPFSLKNCNQKPFKTFHISTSKQIQIFLSRKQISFKTMFADKWSGHAHTIIRLTTPVTKCNPPGQVCLTRQSWWRKTILNLFRSIEYIVNRNWKSFKASCV